MRSIAEQPLLLDCQAKQYDWGKVGNKSLVYKLVKMNKGQADEQKPYAELWMGTHPNSPSYHQSEPLSEIIKKHPAILGDRLYRRWGSVLPFLFKVLSINKPLSIQAHPDKQLAELLHMQHPDIYKDNNHKPEMAIALTPFEALSGFRMPSAIKHNLKNYEELREVVGVKVAEEFCKADGPFVKEALRQLFMSLMKAPAEKISSSLDKMISRLQSSSTKSTLDSLIIQLHMHFPGDVGCFCALLLNHVKLAPYQAFYMGANEPHAYISGDCLECMATSDNVVRAGLTPKFKDVDTLCTMLNYSFNSPEEQTLNPTKLTDFTVCYSPPIEEFSVTLTRLAQGDIEKFPSFDGPTVAIVLEGNGVVKVEQKEIPLNEGNVLLFPNKFPIEIMANSTKMTVSMAMVNQTDFC